MTFQQLKEMTFKEWFILFLIIGCVIGVGMFAVNQTLSYYYKSQLLQTPCGLCEELNPHLEDCFQRESTNIFNLTPIEDTRELIKKINLTNITDIT